MSDGSTDGTKRAVDSLASTPLWSGYSLRCEEQEWRGAAAARNKALHLAVAPIVLFLDDDVIAGPDLLMVHLACHAAAAGDREGTAGPGAPGTVVLGHIETTKRQEALHRQMHLWWLDHYSRLAQTQPGYAAFFTGNVSLPRQAAIEAGGFDESLDYSEDIEFGYRLRALGLRFRYEPRAFASTYNPKPASGLLRDLYRAGQGSVRIYRKFPEALPTLPLSAYGETNIRMRVVRGVLLALAEKPGGARLVNRAFSMWAASIREGKLDRQLFELARSYFFWRGVRAEVKDKGEWSQLTSPGVAVLTYHSVEPAPKGAMQRYTVDPMRFALQMRVLRLLRYRVVSLSSLVRMWSEGELPPPRCVAISFDDGYRDNMQHAWPILRKFGYGATLFFVSGLAGKSSIWDEGIEGGAKALLTWAELITLDKQGFRVEAHSVSHADLAGVSREVAEVEIAESRRILEEKLKRPVQLFAYPYGHYNSQVEGQVARAGYRAAFSVKRGLNTLRTPRFALNRVTISGDDNILMFALKVWAGDDPLRYLPGFRRIVDRKSKGKRTEARIGAIG